MRLVMLLVAASVGTLLSDGVCQSSPKQGGWKEYVYSSEGFAITLPHDPNPHHDPTMPEMTAYTVHLSQQASVTLRVSSQARDCAGTLRQLKDGALSGKQPGLVAGSIKDVSVSGRQGVEWEFVEQPGDKQYERFICTEGKFYFFAAGWPSSERRPQAVERIVNSFRFLNAAAVH